jgi:hypothetical protein
MGKPARSRICPFIKFYDLYKKNSQVERTKELFYSLREMGKDAVYNNNLTREWFLVFSVIIIFDLANWSVRLIPFPALLPALMQNLKNYRKKRFIKNLYI